MFLLADWLEGIVPLLLVVFWVVRAFLDSKNEQQAKPPADRKKPAKQTQPGPVAKGPFQDPFEDPVRASGRNSGQTSGQKTGGGNEAASPFDDFGDQDRTPPTREAKVAGGAGDQDSIRSEVDEFLKRLSQPAPEQEPPKRKPPKKQKPRKKRVPTAAGNQRDRLQSSLKPQQLDGRSEGESVDEHVRSHLGHLEESQLAENAALMGSKIAQSDDRLEARLHEKFDHKLGKLESRKAETVKPVEPQVPSTAEAIAKMLSSPDGMRQAVVLNEILQRPSDRW